MPDDKIMVWHDWADEPPPPRGILVNNREPTYPDFMARHWEQSHDGDYTPDTLPPKPDALSPLHAFVDHGRWMVVCECSGSAAAAEPGEDFLCHACETWHSVVFPEDRADIEAKLLMLPGHRHQAQERNWSP